MRNCDIPDAEIPLADREQIIRQFSGWVKRIAKRYSTALELTGAVDDQDLFQVGCMALLRAQETYVPGKGYGFLRHSQYLIRNAMRRELGIDPNTGKMPAPLISLDEQLTEDTESTLMDVVPDDNTPTPEERTVAQDGQQEIVDTVRGAVDRLKSAKHREVISRIWLDGQDKQTAAEEMGISLASLRNLDLKARYKLRRDRKLRTLAFPLYHVGVNSFHRTSLSAVELCVLWREQRFDEVFGSGSFAGTRDRDEE